jgi:hypothetical protein
VTDSRALLARLREHVNGGRRGCSKCDPARGRYCPQAAPLAEAFYAARRADVLAERWRRVA